MSVGWIRERACRRESWRDQDQPTKAAASLTALLSFTRFPPTKTFHPPLSPLTSPMKRAQFRAFSSPSDFPLASYYSVGASSTPPPPLPQCSYRGGMRRGEVGDEGRVAVGGGEDGRRRGTARVVVRRSTMRFRRRRRRHRPPSSNRSRSRTLQPLSFTSSSHFPQTFIALRGARLSFHCTIGNNQGGSGNGERMEQSNHLSLSTTRPRIRRPPLPSLPRSVAIADPCPVSTALDQANRGGEKTNGLLPRRPARQMMHWVEGKTKRRESREARVRLGKGGKGVSKSFQAQSG